MKLSYLAGNKPGYFNCCDNLARKNIIQTRTVFNICIILKYCICSRKYNNLKFTNEIESLLLLLLLLTIIKLDILNLKSNVNSGKMINVSYNWLDVAVRWIRVLYNVYTIWDCLFFLIPSYVMCVRYIRNVFINYINYCKGVLIY